MLFNANSIMSLVKNDTLGRSTTSLDTIPDIVIPLPLYNPLPLQCLAANALPEEVKMEIEEVVSQCCLEHDINSEDSVSIRLQLLRLCNLYNIALAVYGYVLKSCKFISVMAHYQED